MSFFKKLFSSTPSNENQDESLPQVRNESNFGRYTEVNRPPKQLSYWGTAISKFNEKRYLDSFNDLLQYMHDPTVNNTNIQRNSDEINFELIQGSKIIRGKANNNVFTAEAKIARFDRLNVAFLRKLMSMNFVHQYTRFAIKDDNIFLKFDSKTIDASPNKVYFSLRELALKADKIDDTLIGEFDVLHPIDVGQIIEIPDNIKEVKFKYLHLWINETLNKIAQLNEDKLSGGISFMILGLLFRIDYLLQPQGNLFDDIDKINAIYNAKDNKTTLERNRCMIDELTKILRKDKEDIKKSFYSVKATFGYVPVTTHKDFYEFILEHFKDTTWYYNNNYPDIITSIYEWIIGYALFYFGLYPATYDLLRMTYQVMYPDFFTEMGIKHDLSNSHSKQINKAAVDKEIQIILKQHKKDYPNLVFINQNIICRSTNEFLYSFLNEITYLNFSK